MTKQEQEKLEKENAQLKEQIAGLTKRLEEAEKQRPASKSRQMAVAALAMLAEGPCTVDKFVKLNAKYPSDCIFYARSLLHADIRLVRRSGQPNVYMLAEHFLKYQEGLQKEKAAAEASKQEIKEELQTPQTQASAAPEIRA